MEEITHEKREIDDKLQQVPRASHDIVSGDV